MSEEKPNFLDFIDSSFDRFYKEFYRYCHSRLLDPPVPFLRDLEYDERLEFVHAFVFHCMGQDQRWGVLKRYDSRRGSFAAWLYVVALNKYLQQLRRIKREVRIDVFSSADGIDSNLAIQQTVDNDGAELNDINLVQYLQEVERVIEELGERCQGLFRFLQDGYEPKDVDEYEKRVGKLYSNKWIGTHISRCRERLRRILTDRGLPISLNPMK